MSHHVVTVPCLGRSFQLGSLYDCQTDTLLEETLWAETVIVSVLQTKFEGSEAVDIITASSLGEKMKALEFNPGLRLNMLTGGLSSTGILGPIVDYLQEEQTPNDRVRIHLRYSTTSNIEEVDPQKIKGQCNEASKQATHVVYKIQYGSDAFFAFDCQVKADETHAEVQGSMKEVMESLKHRICANSENKTSEGVMALDSEQVQKYECKYYHCDSKVFSSKSLKYLEDVVEVCKDHTISNPVDEACKGYPSSLTGKKTSTGPGIPKLVWLVPLSQLSTDNDTPQCVTTDISEVVADNVQKVLEDNDKQLLQVSDMMAEHNDALSKLKSLHKDLCHFQEAVKLFGSTIVNRIHSYLPKVQSGNVSENELIENVDQTPFNSVCLSQWLDQKKKDIEMVSRLILSDLSVHGIAFTEGIPQADDQENTVVVYYVCNVTPKNDMHLDAMEKHVQARQYDNGWSQDTRSQEQLKEASERFKLFTAYAESNKCKGNVKFVVVECNYDYSSDCGSTVLSSHGKREAFQLPSKPGTLRIDPVSVAHNSVQLQWTKPEKGSENIRSYKILYYPQSDTPNQLRDWACSTTIDSCESFTLNNLKSKTKYTFKICPVLQKAPDIICLESDQVEIETSQRLQQEDQFESICQPGRPRATSVTHNKITLKWSKPKHGSKHVDMYIISYRLLEANDGDWENIPPQTDSECELMEKMTIGEDILEPNKKYVFKVTPFCLESDIEIKESEMSDPIETVPICRPGKPTAVFVTHNSIKLKWSKPMFGSESVSLYMVHYRQYNELQGKWSKTTVKSTPNPQQTTTIKGLEVNVRYVFKVTPFSSKSTIKTVSSEESDPIETEQSCQTGKPKPLTVTHNSITITWDKPEHWSNQINFYRVYCHKSNKPEDNPITEITESTNLKLSNLELGAKYVFWVKPDCVNKGVKTMNSEVSDEIETKPSCQPGKPQAISTTHDSVSLKWDKPEYNYENVELYTISYSSINCDGNNGEWSRLKTKLVEIEVQGLCLGEKYVFKVEAVCRDEGCNVVESEQSDIIVTKTTSKPGKPMCSNVQHDKVDMKWKHPEHGYRNVQSYNVTYSIMDASPSTSTSTEMSHVNVPSSTNCTTVIGLTSNLKYCFKVTPVCQNGDGMESDTSDPVQTLPVCLTGKPAVSNIIHNGVTLTWEKQQCGEKNVSGYLLLYKAVGDTQWMHIDVGECTTYKVTGLKVHTKYVFKVRTRYHNTFEAIDSELSNEIEIKPTCQPGKPIATSVTHDTVVLKWDKPEYNYENVGLYIVAYQSEHESSDKWSQDTTKDPQGSIEIKGLSMGTKYRFKVKPECINTDDKCAVAESETSLIETMATSKLGLPFICNIRHNKVDVVWTHPEFGQKNVTSYKVMTQLISGHESSADWTLKKSSPRDCTATISGLLSNSEYQFKVIPICRSGQGTESDTSHPIKTSPACQTTKPIASNITHNSVTLKWEKPGYRSDQIRHYHVLYHSLPMQRQTQLQQATRQSDGHLITEEAETHITVPNLTMDTKYLFTIVPECIAPEVTGVESEESEQIRTKAASPPEGVKVSVVSHDSTNVMWSRPKNKISSKISFYLVSYRVVDDHDKSNWKTQQVSGNDYKCTVKGLTASTQYVFKVCAGYANGIQSCEESNVTELIRTNPSCKPGRIQCTSIFHDAIHLQWCKPTDFSSNVRYYKVSCCTLDHLAQWINVAQRFQYVKIEINKLKINTGYVFKVEPVCNKQNITVESTESDIIYTKATSKPGTPEVRTQHSISHNSIELKWSFPEIGFENITSFTVFYRSAAKKRSQWYQQEVYGNQTHAKIDGLTPKIAYVFKVRANCHKTEGTGSDSHVSYPIQTKGTSPPGKPFVTEVTYNSLKLSWSRPECGSENVTCYYVKYWKESDTSSAIEPIVKTDTCNCEIMINELAPSTKYIFKVIPECVRIKGSESEISDVVETKPLCRPGIPKVSNVTHDCVKLKWTKPDISDDISLQYYTVSYWLVNDPDKKMKTGGQSKTLSLTIQNLAPNTEYKFNVCPHFSDEGIGTEKSTSDIIITRATSKPGIPIASDVTHNSVKLSWKRPDYGIGLINSYKVFCQCLKHPNELISRATTSQQENITFEGLMLNKTYIFKVRTVCKSGLGSDSENSESITTRATSSPGKPVANSVTHDSIHLTWSPPQHGVQNMSSYIVSYCPEVSASNSEWATAKSLRLQTNLTITCLKVNTNYFCKVTSKCKSGLIGMESDQSDFVTMATSKPGKPQVISTTNDTIQLEWSKPEQGSENIESYNVYYTEAESDNQHYELVDWKQYNTKSNNNNAILTELTVKTCYVFKVLPVCYSGTGSKSDDSDSCWTKATSPPGTPEAVSVTHDTIQLKWSKPVHGSENVDHYVVSCTIEDSVLQRIKSEGDKEFLEVNGLEPGSRYTFTVNCICIQNRKGMESASCKPVQTKVTSPPGKPTTDAKNENTHKKVSLKWTQPAIGYELIKHYKVHYKLADMPPDKWLGSTQTHNNSTVVTVSQLTPKTKYVFKVEPVCDSGMGSESEYSDSIVTKPSSKPGKPFATFVGHDCVHLAWDKPKYGSEYVEKYSVSFYSIKHPNSKERKQGTMDCSLELQNLTPGTNYVFQVCPEIKHNHAVDQIYSDPSDPIETFVTSKPGTPEPYNVVHNSLSLRWTKPDYGGNSVIDYAIHYKEVSAEDWKLQENEIDTSAVVGGLKPGKKYLFYIQPKCNNSKGAASDACDPTETKSTSQPGKPTVNGNITHDSISICWSAPTYSMNLAGYSVLYRARDGSDETWNTHKVNSPRNNTLTVKNLQPRTNYIFKVSSICSAGIGAESECSDAIETMPLCKPGKPKICESTHESLLVEWEKPQFGNVIKYNVHCKEKKGSQLCQESTTDNKIQLKKLKPKTEYHVQVSVQIEPESGIGIEKSDIATLMTKQTPPAERMKAKSTLLTKGEPGYPDVYLVPIRIHTEDKENKLRKCFVEADTHGSNEFCSEKVIMIVGATGTGKTTLINGLVNHVLGVKWEDSYRFKMIVEESQDVPTKSQTKWITSYTIQGLERSYIDFQLTIIDTPGFGDTEGIERDQRLVEQIRAFFGSKGDKGIDQIHAIGFATQAGLPRLTAPQKYIFHSIMSVFGNDVKDNIFMMTTFADGQPPPVLKAVKEAGVPFHKAFKFNNSALFAAKSTTSETSAIDKIFWKMGNTSFTEFFSELSKTIPKSLTLTKEVLEEREHLEVCVEDLQQQVHLGLSKINALRQEEQVLKKFKAQLDLNQDFEYTVDVMMQRKVNLECGKHVTNCLTCNRTCHYPCYIPKDEDKHSCAAMGTNRHTPEAQCTVCPGKCHWEQHFNNPYRFEFYTVKETKTSEDLKKRYHDAKGGKLQVEKMVAKLHQDLDAWYQDVLVIIRRTQRILKRLQEIALKPDHLTEVGYIDLLIKSEKQEAKPGYIQRIQALEQIKGKAKLLSLSKLPPEKFNPNSPGRGWESFLCT